MNIMSKTNCHICDFVLTTEENEILTICPRCDAEVNGSAVEEKQAEINSSIKVGDSKSDGTLYLTDRRLIFVENPVAAYAGGMSPYGVFFGDTVRSFTNKTRATKATNILFEDIRSVEVVNLGVLGGSGLSISTADNINYTFGLGSKIDCNEWADMINKKILMPSK